MKAHDIKKDAIQRRLGSWMNGLGLDGIMGLVARHKVGRRLFIASSQQARMNHQALKAHGVANMGTAPSASISRMRLLETRSPQTSANHPALALLESRLWGAPVSAYINLDYA